MPAALFHALESRTLWSVTLDNGALNVIGTANRDQIYIWRDANDAATLHVKLNNKTSSFAQTDVQSIFVRTHRGDDTVKLLSSEMTTPSKIYTDAGIDEVEVWGGATRLYLGDGNDRGFAHYVRTRAILYGENGDDTLNGGYGNDLINGGDGDDSMNGMGGANTVLGGAGNDFISGNNFGASGVPSGNNLLDGGEGNDTLAGWVGDDTLLGGAGDDVLFAFAGNDLLSGGAGADDLDGGAGNDLLSGGAANDDVLGIDAGKLLADQQGADDGANANIRGEELEPAYAAYQ